MRPIRDVLVTTCMGLFAGSADNFTQAKSHYLGDKNELVVIRTEQNRIELN